MSITFRKLQPGESKIYRELRLECLKNFPNWFGSTYEEQILLPKLTGEITIEDGSREKFILGAFSDNILIGICAFNQEARRKVRHRAEITQVYLKPEYQGKKIGQQMIRSIVSEAFANPEIEQLELGVETSNFSAIRVYEKNGFEQFGHIKNFFKDGKKYFDEYLMVLYRKT
jgi:ribosomal protein S18 acetylase RimI-like enzyme